jgi:vacuolar protein sorting-associated protein VTA1
MLWLSNDTHPPTQDAEKIKYAKWKAAEISKAIREGRQPVAGPAGGLLDHPAPPITMDTSEPPEPAAQALQISAVGATAPMTASQEDSRPVPEIITPSSVYSAAPLGPSHNATSDDYPREHASLALPLSEPLPSGLAHSSYLPTTPGSWSTAATPGIETPGMSQESSYGDPEPLHRTISSEAVVHGDVPGDGYGNQNTDALGMTMPSHIALSGTDMSPTAPCVDREDHLHASKPSPRYLFP